MELRSRLNGCKRAGREEPVGFARLDPVATTGPRTRFSQTVQATCGSCGPGVDMSATFVTQILTVFGADPRRRTTRHTRPWGFDYSPSSGSIPTNPLVPAGW